MLTRLPAARIRTQVELPLRFADVHVAKIDRHRFAGPAVLDLHPRFRHLARRHRRLLTGDERGRGGREGAEAERRDRVPSHRSSCR